MITENVLLFHSSDSAYYEEWYENVADENGWIVALNMSVSTQEDFKAKHLDRYIELITMDGWRTYLPHHLFQKIETLFSKRLLL